MTVEMWAVLAILAVAIVFFVTDWLRVDLVALGVVAVLMLSGILDTGEALSGFSNPGVLTIAALFVVGGAVLQTGLAGSIGRRILKVAGTGELRLIAAIMLTAALLSALMSDTGTVAVLMPATLSLAVGAGISPSRLLMPLSFGALLGGAMTLIGTLPNVIVSDLLSAAGEPSFGFFSFTPVGLALLLVGLAYMLMVGRRLLGRNREPEPQRVASPAELVEHYRLPDDLFRLRVRRGSGLVGRTLGQSRLRSEAGATVLEIFRSVEPRPFIKVGRQELGLRARGFDQIVPDADTVFALDDVLVVRGRSADVWHAAASWNLGVQRAKPEDEAALVDQEAGIAEVVLPPRSALLGKTLLEADFARRFRLTVLAINRPGSDGALDLESTALRFGDVLLVQGPWQHILALKDKRKDFVVMGQPEAMLGAPARRRAPVAAGVLLGMVALIATGVVSVAAASLLAALLMVLTGCLTMDQAYESVDWRSVVLIAGMISLSVALQKVELVDLVAQGLTDSLGAAGPLALLAGIFLLTSAFTQVLSNTATTVLVAPIALAAAGELGVAPQAFVMAVAIAASMAFASPVSSPVNTLVMGAADYRFRDYLKVGLPLTVLMLVVAVAVLPLLFPF